MDQKLAEYRAKKKKQHFIDSSKKQFLSLFQRKKSEMEDFSQTKTENIDIEDDCLSVTSTVQSDEEEAPCCDALTYSKFLLYASLWLVLYSLAIYLEFGAVFFVISGLYIVWANTRTGPKRRGEVSAYSVFNPNCEAIEGTLKPEQFEREIRYGVL